MNKPIQIYIDTSGKAHVSYECDSCGEWTRTDEHCGDEGQYLCPDCYSQQLADQKYIHDWLIFVDDANPLECRIAIHKDVVHPDRIDDADCSSPDPDDDISRFGPGTSVYTLSAFEDLHTDVCHIWLLVDEGFITWQGATQIFNAQGGAK
jgi:predicted RNA-binding Zn-ribbon protein involved in translation (DUF1610 family)